MLRDEILSHLFQTKGQWKLVAQEGITIGRLRRAGKTPSGYECNFCPITSYAMEQLGEYFNLSDYQQAGQALGAALEEIVTIGLTADANEEVIEHAASVYDSVLREDMLGVLGLKELS